MRQLGLRSARDLRLFLLRRSVGRSARLVLDVGVNFVAAMACSATFRGLLLLDERTMADALRAALCGVSAFGTGWFLTTVRCPPPHCLGRRRIPNASCSARSQRLTACTCPRRRRLQATWW